jgi:hypothetical protein
MKMPNPGWRAGAGDGDDGQGVVANIAPPAPPDNQPIEHHDPIGGDKLFLPPSGRRPLQRDLLRLVERFRREPVRRPGP